MNKIAYSVLQDTIVTSKTCSTQHTHKMLSTDLENTPKLTINQVLPDTLNSTHNVTLALQFIHAGDPQESVKFRERKKIKSLSRVTFVVRVHSSF